MPLLTMVMNILEILAGIMNCFLNGHLVGKVIVLACDILTKIDAISFCIYCIFIYYLNFNQTKSIYHPHA